MFGYLGIDLDFESTLGALIILMIKYLQEVINKWPEELKGHKTNPHRDHLFDVREDNEREFLPEEMVS